MPRLAVVGAGWAGLAAAVRAVQAGWSVSVFEMAPHIGGRARSTPGDAPLRDNGQHILIGAYQRTLGLMAELGVPLDDALLRLPLTLQSATGLGLRLPRATLPLALPWAWLQAGGWSLAERWSLVVHAARWARAGFTCDPHWTVAQLCAGMPGRLRRHLIDPLCVAAMNTPAAQASASVFLRVLHDALLSGRGSSDMLLPRWPLHELLPAPAWRWLGERGAALHAGQRVLALTQDGSRWRVDGEAFGAVVLACTAVEASRLVQPIAPDWARQAAALDFEPIVTVQLQADGVKLPQPILALDEGPDAPAQFLFDHGAIGAAPGWFSAVISGAAAWVDAGRDATAQAVAAQLRSQGAGFGWPAQARVSAVLADRRATFRCVPGLQRPVATVAPGLVAAGDYVEGPYPATLEGAVMAGERAVLLLSG